MAATTQKKTTTKSSTAKKNGGSGRAKKPAQPQKRPIRREVWGVVLLVLTLCTAVSYFKVSAIFIDWFAALLKGLFGYGYWLAAPALLYAGVTLLNHKGRPVKLRTACTLLLPVLLGMVLHLLLSRGNYAFSLEGIKPLWKDGQVLLCGGGARNPAIAAMLQRELPGSRVGRTEDAGLPGDAKEAVAFAVLGYETMNRRPGNLPAATGASGPVVLGSVTWG